MKRAVGVTLSSAQADEVNERKLPGVECVSYRLHEVRAEGEVRRAHLDLHDRSPLLARGGAPGQGRRHLPRVLQEVLGAHQPGAWFGLQTILRNRTRCGPGAPCPTRRTSRTSTSAPTRSSRAASTRASRRSIQAVNPYWEVVQVTHAPRGLPAHHRRVAAPPAPQREDHPRPVGRQGLRRLRPLPRHVRARLRQALQLARAISSSAASTDA